MTGTPPERPYVVPWLGVVFAVADSEAIPLDEADLGRWLHRFPQVFLWR